MGVLNQRGGCYDGGALINRNWGLIDGEGRLINEGGVKEWEGL